MGGNPTPGTPMNDAFGQADDEKKTRGQLLLELMQLRRRILQFEGAGLLSTSALEQRELAVQILTLLNRPVDKPELISGILDRIREFTGFEAVAIRLGAGSDFPYYDAKGLPAHFMEAEQYLGSRDPNGSIVLNCNGTPALRCMCGEVLRGPGSASAEFLTDNGSFWSNSLTDFIESLSAEEYEVSPLHRCKAEGYESIALIPLKSETGTVLGLLQLADTRKGMLASDAVHLLERLCLHIATGLERKESEEAVRRSEARYRTLIDNASEGCAIINAEGTVIYESPSNEQVLGRSPEESRGMNIFDMIHPKDHPRLVGDFARLLLELGGVRTGVYRSLHKDGSWRHIEATARNMTNDPNIEGMVVSYRDVSRRIRAEEELRQSREKYRTLVDNLAVSVAQIGADGCLLLMNETAARGLGGRAADFQGKRLHDVFPADRADEYLAYIEQVAESRQRATIETTVDLPAGQRWVLLNLQPMLDADGRAESVQVIVTDISRQKRVESDFRAKEQELAAIYENAPIIMILVDEERRVHKVNRAGVECAGRPPEKMIGLRGGEALKCIHAADHPAGCGFGEFCQKCTVRNAVLDTFAHGNAHHRIEGSLMIERDGNAELVHLLVSTALLDFSDDRMVLVCMEEITHLKRTEEALRLSEERLRLLFEGSHELITINDAGARILWANPAWTAAFGPASERESTLLELVHPEDRKRIEKVWEGIVSGRSRTEQVEYRCRNPQGVYVLLDATLYPAGQGDEHLIFLVAVDITERRRIEQALEKLRKQHELILNAAGEGICGLDTSGVITFINPKAADLLGWKVDELAGRDLHEAAHHSSPDGAPHPREECPLCHAVKDGTEVHADSDVFWRKDWTSFPVEFTSTPISDEAGHVIGAVVTFNDITHRKRAEELILQRYRELAALNEIAQTVTQTLELDSILRSALETTLRILDTGHGSIYILDRATGLLDLKVQRGMTFEQARDVAKARPGEGLVGKVALTGQPLYTESLADAPGLREEGLAFVRENRLRSAMLVPLKAKGEVLGVLCAVTEGDRTLTTQERELLTTIGLQVSAAIENAKLLEEASRADALAELDRLRRELLASVSHELRTPLTAIKGLADSLIQPDVEWDSETQHDFLNTIKRESDALNRMVNDLMEMSQIEAGIMPMVRNQGSMWGALKRINAQLKELTRHHTLSVNVPLDLPSLYVDESRIAEVIANLISNAAAYSKPGTQITIEASRVGDEIIVSVSDQGSGIPPEHRDKVFDRFYRLESGFARRRGGTGLGLAICKGIVEAHNGRIWVDSLPGRGSRFSFSLPITEDPDT